MRRTSNPRAGFTVIEMCVATCMLSIVLGAAMMVSASASHVSSYATMQNEVQAHARRAIDRIAAELANAGVGQLAPDPGALGTSSFTFRCNTGIDAAGNSTWGTLSNLELVSDPSDPDDGVDNNGNGLVDERCLQLTRDFGGPNQLTTILCRNVTELAASETANGADDNGNGLIDEPGFIVTRGNDLLTLRLTIEERSPDGRVARTEVETSLTLRN
jgi:type II secretory pathway pseudopilin PulG